MIALSVPPRVTSLGFFFGFFGFDFPAEFFVFGVFGFAAFAFFFAFFGGFVVGFALVAFGFVVVLDDEWHRG